MRSLNYRLFRSVLALGVVLGLGPAVAQTTVPFTSGPIPLCDTSIFTANVSGIGQLIPPGMGWGGEPYLDALTINITTDHPQTLQILLTSPEGTTLLLSEFNGAGGQNYTNTTFSSWAWNDITNGTAPFTGDWYPQGGSLSVFDYENANGTWTITVIDTACATGGPGPGPGNGWNPGWFSGGAGSGGFSFNFYYPPPPCGGWFGDEVVYICEGGSADLIANATILYPWLTINVTDENGLPVPDPAAVTTPGYYYLDAIDPWDGCWFYGSYQVYASPLIDLGPDGEVEQCTGAGTVNLLQLFSLTGLSTTWTLDGSPITNTQAMAASTSGVYQVTATNIGGCTDVAAVTLNMLPAPILGPDQVVGLCPGGTVDLNTLYATAGSTVEWSYEGAPFDDPMSATDAGFYTLEMTSSAGCVATTTVEVIVEPLTPLGPDQTLDICSTATADLTTLYNTSGSTASWTLAGVPVPTPAAINEAGNYRLVISNGMGCADTAWAVVSVLQGPLLGADVSVTVCSGNVTDLGALFNATGYSTGWYLDGAVVPDVSAVADPGSYLLVATDMDGCSDTAYVALSVDQNPVLGADQSIAECSGTMIDLTTVVTAGSSTIEWTLSGVPVPDVTSVTQSGSYVAIATNTSGCTATSIVTVSFDPTPTLGADQAFVICQGEAFDLSGVYASSGSDADWSFGGNNVTDPVAVVEAGTYQLIVSNSAGCSDTALVTLSVNAGPSLGGNLAFTLCPWQSVDLGAVFPVLGLEATYTLDGQSVVDPSAVSTPGVYMAAVVDGDGCAAEATATITAMECLCEADFIEDAGCMQVPVQFTLVADSLVLDANWDFNGAASPSALADPLVQFTSDGEVLVTVNVTLTCGVVTVERSIMLEDCNDACTVYIPNAFTPDNDSRNDTWSWSGECVPEDYAIQVFNRWGELVFASTDPMEGWDGFSNGRLSPSGVYAYRVGYRLPYQKRREVMGSVTLVR